VLLTQKFIANQSDSKRFKPRISKFTYWIKGKTYERKKKTFIDLHRMIGHNYDLKET
jgi:hypothetical protein